MSYVDDIREYRPKNLPLMRRVLDMFHEYGFYEEELSLLNRMMKEIESRDEEYCTLLLRCVKVNRIRKHFKEALKQLELYNSLVQKQFERDYTVGSPSTRVGRRIFSTRSRCGYC